MKGAPGGAVACEASTSAKGDCPSSQVTDHATTALLHYQLPQMPDVVVRSFMVSGFRGPAFQLGRDLKSQPQVVPGTSIRAERAVTTEVAFQKFPALMSGTLVLLLFTKSCGCI